MSLKTIALAPVFVPQALWTAARAARLPEAAGDRSGVLGAGPVRKLLVLGDSSAAGVGAEHQSEALAGQLAAALSSAFTVEWKLVARSGETVRSTSQKIDAMEAEKFDFVIIALGVNDTKNGVSARNWERGYRHLLDMISKKFDPQKICVSGVPFLGGFPILPTPLNTVLGDRSKHFDVLLTEIAGVRKDTIHLPADFTFDETTLASDGLHPGPVVYREWARRAAAVFAGVELTRG
ncbi:MAG: SGNH/GDSL hydrolase family protein [Pseudomonadota bacterium]